MASNFLLSRAELSVAVVGGGIGGLAAALALLHAGFDVQVFEQAAALGEIGAGIQISPNASRLLHRLGLAEALERTGVRPVAFHRRRWDDGRILERAPLGEAVEAAFPHFLTRPLCRPTDCIVRYSPPATCFESY